MTSRTFLFFTQHIVLSPNSKRILFTDSITMPLPVPLNKAFWLKCLMISVNNSRKRTPVTLTSDDTYLKSSTTHSIRKFLQSPAITLNTNIHTHAHLDVQNPIASSGSSEKAEKIKLLT